ncbi:MAG: hypothetical protein CBB68_09560 [Rhodospirillaceae bacterium TMED8]|nr:hypothetical protein [Magnetovibrio sp.]OUT50107.1 MAG: hypothetical protein CBB68_09560 [Rhodospirillaceae bacterium TMED8]
MSEEDNQITLKVFDPSSEEVSASLFQRMEDAMMIANNADYAAAITECQNIIKAWPRASEPYFLMGNIAYVCNEHSQAISMCELAHKIDPEVKEYAEALATIYTSLGRLSDGLYFAKIAPEMAAHPLFSARMPARLRDLKGALTHTAPTAYLIEALRLFNLADYNRVITECMNEIRINATNKKAFVLLGRAAIILKRYSQAVGALQAAIHIDPKDGWPVALLARALAHLGRFSESEAAARRGIELGGLDIEIYCQAMDALLRSPSVSLDALKDSTQSFNKQLAEQLDTQDEVRSEGGSDGKIGVISNAFFNAPESAFVNQWLKGRKSNKVEFHGYQLSVKTDVETTTIQQGCESWREIFDLDPYTLSFTLASEELTALLDLSDINGDTRLSSLSMCSSPIRVGAITLPEPSLIPGITHILSDDILAEADQNALLAGQQIIKVKGSLFSHPPFINVPQIEVCPALEKNQITFGGIFDLAFLSPQCATLWADVLQNVDNSYLLLCGPKFISDEAQARVREYFSIAGVADKILLPNLNVEDEDEDGEDDPLVRSAMLPIPHAQMVEIDVFLDTTPISSHREICQSLWSGVPVLTLESERRMGRCGASILTAAGRVNWITGDRCAFIDTAVELTKDTSVLKSEREALRKVITNSDLFDPATTAQNFNDAMARMITTYAVTHSKQA